MQIIMRGEQFGIEIVEPNESGPVLKLMTEDDEHWHDVTTFSAFWLNDLIDVLQAMQMHLEES